jgi:hypothetical protein
MRWAFNGDSGKCEFRAITSARLLATEYEQKTPIMMINNTMRNHKISFFMIEIPLGSGK